MSFRDFRKISANWARRSFEVPVYSAGIALYRMGVGLAGLGNHKAHLLDAGQHQIRNTINEHLKPGDRVVWVHAASLGEFEQGRPLIERIRKDNPEYKILLTFFSPSGYEVRKNYAGADCVCYLPFDTPVRVYRFLELVKPEMAIFVKYEIWRNYLAELSRRKIPTYLISAAFRPSQKFFKKSFSWYGDWLRWFKTIFVQNEESRRLLHGIGIDNVEVTGDTRFDQVANIRATRRPIPELEAFTAPEYGIKPMVMVAGSSWPLDEDVYVPWINAHPEVKLVIAPHEFDSQRLERLRARFNHGAALMSELKDHPEASQGRQVLIIDCFGILSSAYAYCDVAYVGGGFGVGIHNINEPAVYGVPVIYGPNHTRFIEANEMAKVGCGLPVSGRDSFELIADSLLNDESGRRKRGQWAEQYIQSKLGATDKVYEAIFRSVDERKPEEPVAEK